jgi:hypothetical protein
MIHWHPTAVRRAGLTDHNLITLSGAIDATATQAAVRARRSNLGGTALRVDPQREIERVVQQYPHLFRAGAR